MKMSRSCTTTSTAPAITCNSRAESGGRMADSLQFTRRDVLKGTLIFGGMTTLSPYAAFAQPQTQGGDSRAESPKALVLARMLNGTKFSDLPPKAVMHAKMSLA